MKLLVPLLAIGLTLLSGIASANDPKLVHCKVSQLELKDNPHYDEVFEKYYLLSLLCQEDLVAVFKTPGFDNHHESRSRIPYNKISSQLLPHALLSQKIFPMILTSPYFSQIIAVDGQNIDFADGLTLMPAVPGLPKFMRTDEVWALSGSPLIDLMIKSNLNFVSPNGYTIKVRDGKLLITGETGQKELEFSYGDPRDRSKSSGRIYGTLAKTFLAELKKAGVQTTIYKHNNYSGLLEDEYILVETDKNKTNEMCWQRTYLDPNPTEPRSERDRYHCDFVGNKQGL